MLAWLALSVALADDSIAAAVVLDGAEIEGDRTLSAVVLELRRRQWTVSPVTAPLEGDSTAARLWKLRAAAATDVVVLVETEAQFYAQVAGRYRWTVQAHVTVAPSEVDGESLERTVEVPVFLVYDHQREADALAEASVMLARKVGAVCRDYRDGER